MTVQPFPASKIQKPILTDERIEFINRQLEKMWTLEEYNTTGKDVHFGQMIISSTELHEICTLYTRVGYCVMAKNDNIINFKVTTKDYYGTKD